MAISPGLAIAAGVMAAASVGSVGYQVATTQAQMHTVHKAGNRQDAIKRIRTGSPVKPPCAGRNNIKMSGIARRF